MRAGSQQPSASSAFGFAILAGAAALASWWWQTTVFRAPRLEADSEHWEVIKQTYPLPAPVTDISPISHDALETILQENPFSSERRPASAAGTPGSQGTEPEPMEVSQPEFAYKGRINLGQRQRAIVEDLRAKKTYFLEVGQVVATFKVLDITESQVLLSDPQHDQTVVVPLTSPSTRSPGVIGRGPEQTTKQDEAPRGQAR